MSASTTASPSRREPELLGQTVVVIGGSAGMGLETARRASIEGARVVLTGRDPERLERAASELDALSSAAFDATDPASLERFFRDLPATIDHVMVTAGRPHYGRLIDLDFEEARRAVDEHILLMIQVARNARKVRLGGTLLFVGGTGARRPVVGLGMVSTITAALPVLTANLALELARPGQPHRRRLCRYTVVGVPARRRTRKPPQAASRNASHRTRRRTRRRRRTRGAHHD